METGKREAAITSPFPSTQRKRKRGALGLWGGGGQDRPPQPTEEAPDGLRL